MNGHTTKTLDENSEVEIEEDKSVNYFDDTEEVFQSLLWSPYSPFGNSPDPKYRLSYLSEKYGRENSFFIHLIERYKIIVPSKANYGGRIVYAFSQCDVERIERVIQLQDAGYRIGEIAEIMGDQDVYKQTADEIFKALGDWNKRPNGETWNSLVEAVLATPVFTNDEKEVLGLFNRGQGPAEICRQLRFENEKQVRMILESAQTKLGKAIFRLFHHMGTRQ